MFQSFLLYFLYACLFLLTLSDCFSVVRVSSALILSMVSREAQKFVNTMVHGALKGSGIGYFSKLKLEKVLVDEQLRYQVCSQILEASKSPQGVQVTDVVRHNYYAAQYW